jgi:hypothetical protein
LVSQGGISYTFPQGTVVPGRGYLVVASNPSALASGIGYSGALGPYGDRLANSGEEVRLVNNSARLMNVVEYGDQGDWPVGPDGSGFSLAKLDAYSSRASRELARQPSAQERPAWRISYRSRSRACPCSSNEVAAASTAFWLEIVNQEPRACRLAGTRWHVGGTGSSYVIVRRCRRANT